MNQVRQDLRFIIFQLCGEFKARVLQLKGPTSISCFLNPIAMRFGCRVTLTETPRSSSFMSILSMMIVGAFLSAGLPRDHFENQNVFLHHPCAGISSCLSTIRTFVDSFLR
jgi:hypothetical protein